MTEPEFRRARSAEAKQQREEAILEAARRLGEARGIRQVTLTDIADEVGMHKSAMLRYFETREQIFLRLTASGWHDWSAALRASLSKLPPGAPPAAVAGAFADSLVARPMFCDLLAQAPLNLERNVSLESVRSFKLVTLEEVGAIGAELRRINGLTEQQGIDVIATATGLAGAFWQMATPGPDVQQLYRSDPRLAHAIVQVGPRLARVLTGLLAGFLFDGDRRCGQLETGRSVRYKGSRGCGRSRAFPGLSPALKSSGWPGGDPATVAKRNGTRRTAPTSPSRLPPPDESGCRARPVASRGPGGGRSNR